jgi:hypothetical protein
MSSNTNWAARDEADKTTSIEFSMADPSVEAVHARPIQGHPGKAWLNLCGTRMRIGAHGDIANLRAWAVEIDRQLALLEIEHRVDESVATTEADGDDAAVTGAHERVERAVADDAADHGVEG